VSHNAALCAGGRAGRSPHCPFSSSVWLNKKPFVLLSPRNSAPALSVRPARLPRPEPHVAPRSARDLADPRRLNRPGPIRTETRVGSVGLCLWPPFRGAGALPNQTRTLEHWSTFNLDVFISPFKVVPRQCAVQVRFWLFASRGLTSFGLGLPEDPNPPEEPQSIVWIPASSLT